MTISIAQTFTTTDGKTFNTRKDANAHQVVLTRIAKINALIDANGLDNSALADDNVVEMIARVADDLIVALSNPMNRGRKPVAPAAA